MTQTVIGVACRYVFCRQRQDETLRRGGEQVSVLVLSTMPFSGALMPLSQAAGHAFFNEGPIALAMVSMGPVWANGTGATFRAANVVLAPLQHSNWQQGLRLVPPLAWFRQIGGCIWFCTPAQFPVACHLSCILSKSLAVHTLQARLRDCCADCCAAVAAGPSATAAT